MNSSTRGAGGRQVRVGGMERERAGERMMEGCCGLRCVGGSEGDMGGKGSRGADGDENIMAG